jgi:hypothetical protein
MFGLVAVKVCELAEARASQLFGTSGGVSALPQATGEVRSGTAQNCHRNYGRIHMNQYMQKTPRAEIIDVSRRREYYTAKSPIIGVG